MKGFLETLALVTLGYCLTLPFLWIESLFIPLSISLEGVLVVGVAFIIGTTLGLTQRKEESAE